MAYHKTTTTSARHLMPSDVVSMPPVWANDKTCEWIAGSARKSRPISAMVRGADHSPTSGKYQSKSLPLLHSSSSLATLQMRMPSMTSTAQLVGLPSRWASLMSSLRCLNLATVEKSKSGCNMSAATTCEHRPRKAARKGLELARVIHSALKEALAMRRNVAMRSHSSAVRTRSSTPRSTASGPRAAVAERLPKRSAAHATSVHMGGCRACPDAAPRVPQRPCTAPEAPTRESILT
mmetsp:Transcript_108904/g.302831  ORF Transcript_108904/g.302831 Transcript_108904/m.302831 type:complete len:236 (+) Transcript_108904:545-1252(+)